MSIQEDTCVDLPNTNPVNEPSSKVTSNDKRAGIPEPVMQSVSRMSVQEWVLSNPPDSSSTDMEVLRSVFLRLLSGANDKTLGNGECQAVTTLSRKAVNGTDQCGSAEYATCRSALSRLNSDDTQRLREFAGREVLSRNLVRWLLIGGDAQMRRAVLSNTSTRLTSAHFRHLMANLDLFDQESWDLLAQRPDLPADAVEGLLANVSRRERDELAVKFQLSNKIVGRVLDLEAEQLFLIAANLAGRPNEVHNTVASLADNSVLSDTIIVRAEAMGLFSFVNSALAVRADVSGQLIEWTLGLRDRPRTQILLHQAGISSICGELLLRLVLVRPRKGRHSNQSSTWIRQANEIVADMLGYWPVDRRQSSLLTKVFLSLEATERAGADIAAA